MENGEKRSFGNRLALIGLMGETIEAGALMGQQGHGLWRKAALGIFRCPMTERPRHTIEDMFDVDTTFDASVLRVAQELVQIVPDPDQLMDQIISLNAGGLAERLPQGKAANVGRHGNARTFRVCGDAVAFSWRHPKGDLSCAAFVVRF